MNMPSAGRFNNYFRFNITSIGVALFHDWYYDFRMKHRIMDPDEKTANFLMPIASEVFTGMGLDLEKHPLEIKVFKSGLKEHVPTATVHANVLTGGYRLTVDSVVFGAQHQDSPSNASHHPAMLRAFLTHESAHIVYHHNFLNLYCSTMLALSVLSICDAWKMHCIFACFTGTASFLSISSFLSRQFELQADRIAAQKDPSIREALLSHFSSNATNTCQPATKSQWLSLYGLFKDHPSFQTRFKALNAGSSGEPPKAR
jgi:hypothetical protein